ncbi:MAG TPA: class I SAM-dependent methyltransferase [Solirubrobacteraceae bacterium]
MRAPAPEAWIEELRRRRWIARIRRGGEARGPWYTEVLAGIALSYANCCYVEIGVEHGVSMSVVAPCCAEAHGCDVADRSGAMPAGARFWHMSSDEFFASYDGAPPALIFIDGDHTYAQARRDYENAGRILAPGGVIALHDTWPGEEANATPDKCGEVWRLEREITAEKFTFAAFPGLTLVRP